MVLPTQKSIELPLLKVMADNDGQIPTAEAVKKVISHFPEMTQEDLASRLKSGANRWRNSVLWATIS